MKLQKLIDHLNEHNCVLKREDSNHSIFLNTVTGKKNAIPRHVEIGDILCNEICKQLEIPKVK